MKELEESIMSDKIFVVEIMKQLEEWIMCDKILKKKSAVKNQWRQRNKII